MTLRSSPRVPARIRGVARIAVVIFAAVIAVLLLALALDRNRSEPRWLPPTGALVERPVEPRGSAGMAGVPGTSADRAAVPVPTPGAPVQAAAPAMTPSASGVIRGKVLDDLERPVARVMVELFLERDGPVSATQAVADGRFDFDGLPGGSYSVRLNAESLPSGVLPPWRQDMGTPGNGNKYEAKRVEMPKTGGTFDVELRVFTPSVAWGRVVGPAGESVEGVHVRLQGAASAGQPSSLMAEAYSDASGRFEIENVYPGRYVAEVYPQSASNSFYHTVPAPIPPAFEILAGGTYDIGVLQLGGGTNTVFGRVVDEEGVPFAGLPVIAYPAGSPGEGYSPYTMSSTLAGATTDDAGRYRLDRLPSAPVKIAAGPDYLGKPLGERLAAFHAPQLEIDLGSGRATYHAEEMVVPRSRPFRVHGTATLDSSWASEHGVTLSKVRFTVRLVDPDAPPVANRPSFRTNRKYRVDKDTGDYEWLCETPHPPVVLVFSSSRGEPEPVEVLVDPQPNGSVEFHPHLTFGQRD